MKEVYHIFRRKCHKSFGKILTDTNVTLIITVATKVTRNSQNRHKSTSKITPSCHQNKRKNGSKIRQLKLSDT